MEETVGRALLESVCQLSDDMTEEGGHCLPVRRVLVGSLFQSTEFAKDLLLVCGLKGHPCCHLKPVLGDISNIQIIASA